MRDAADVLCERLAADLDSAFAEVVTSHGDLVFGVALRVVRDEATAQDVAQDAFVRAYRSMKRYPAERVRALRLRPWLARIALNAARNELRSRRMHEDVDGMPHIVAPGDGPVRMAERRDERRMWERLLGQLPARYRLAVALRHVDGLSYAELAETLGRPLGSVKSDVHRGTGLLRAAYDAEMRALVAREAAS